jgi:PIN domain nuclease of toxin-antitoxin system
MAKQMGQETYLDTNVVIFLHSADVARLSGRAIKQIESADLLVSAMVILEPEMLYEKGTIRYPASQILSDLNQQIGVTVCQLPMAVITNSALQVKWTCEPGDRLIAGNAIANNEAPLVTSDRQIRKQYPNVIW